MKTRRHRYLLLPLLAALLSAAAPALPASADSSTTNNAAPTCARPAPPNLAVSEFSYGRLFDGSDKARFELSLAIAGPTCAGARYRLEVLPDDRVPARGNDRAGLDWTFDHVATTKGGTATTSASGAGVTFAPDVPSFYDGAEGTNTSLLKLAGLTGSGYYAHRHDEEGHLCVKWAVHVTVGAATFTYPTGHEDTTRALNYACSGGGGAGSGWS